MNFLKKKLGHLRHRNCDAEEISEEVANDAIFVGQGAPNSLKPPPITADRPRFLPWPEDEFNETSSNYLEPSENRHSENDDTYDSQDEMDPSIGQTGFFGHGNMLSSANFDDDSTAPEVPPPFLNLTSIKSGTSTSRHDSVGGDNSAHHCDNKHNSNKPATCRDLTIQQHNSTLASSPFNGHKQLTQHHHRPQPNVLGSRISEGLDPNKVVNGIQAMVRMSQSGNKAPPTPPKPNNFVSAKNDSRYLRRPPPTVTPPDSDECEPELPSRLMVVNSLASSTDSSPLSPSPPSSEASSGHMAPQASHKKRQAPLPPNMNRPCRKMELPFNGQVADFKIVERGNNSTPPSSETSSDDVLPAIRTNGSIANKDYPRSRPLPQQSSSSTLSSLKNSPPNVGPNSGQRSSNSESKTSPQVSKLTSVGSKVSAKIQAPLKLQGRQDAGITMGATAFTARQPLNVTVVPQMEHKKLPEIEDDSDGEIYSGAESIQYNLFDFPWYHGHMTRSESEKRLRLANKEGAFLVRDCNNTSSQPNALFTLCLYAQGACHYIQVCRRPEANGRLAVGSQKESEKTFGKLDELVRFHMEEAPLVVQPRSTLGDSAPLQFLCKLTHIIPRKG